MNTSYIHCNVFFVQPSGHSVPVSLPIVDVVVTRLTLDRPSLGMKHHPSHGKSRTSLLSRRSRIFELRYDTSLGVHDVFSR